MRKALDKVVVGSFSVSVGRRNALDKTERGVTFCALPRSLKPLLRFEPVIPDADAFRDLDFNPKEYFAEMEFGAPSNGPCYLNWSKLSISEWSLD